MPRRYLDTGGKQDRIARAKASNTRERNIAKQYFNSGPSIGNLAKAAYHWWNSIPGLGGEDESGNIVNVGYPDAPGFNPKNMKLSTLKKLHSVYKEPMNTIYDDYTNARGLRKKIIEFFIPSNEQGIIKKIPAKTDNEVLNQTIARLVRNNNRSVDEVEDILNKYDKIIKEGYGEYPVKIINKTKGNVDGWYNSLFKTIGVSKDHDITTLGHELRHKIDDVIPLKPEEEYLLQRAYGADFEKGYEHYSNIGKERVTTNRDARDLLLRMYNKNNKYDLSDVSLQNEIIENASNLSIRKAVSESNGYGQDFIMNAKSPNIRAIKDAMKYVGGISTPLVIGYNIDNKFKNGGSIHIAPSKRGTFTAAATKHGMGVQEFAARILRNKDDYSPSLVKKANFARNASKWNH